MDFRTLSFVSQLARKNPRYEYLFKFGLEDLKQRVNRRSYYLNSDRSGMIMGANIDDTNMFYSVGNLSAADFGWIFQFGGSGELHFEPRHLEVVKKLHSPKLGAFEKVRYYRLLDFASAQFYPGCELLGRKNQIEIEALMRTYYPGSVFTGRMLDFPLVGIRRNGELVSIGGTIMMNQNLGSAQVGNLLTVPEQRGKGLSRTIIRHLVATFLSLGLKEIRLEVYDKNLGAWKLYEKLGFSLEKFGFESQINCLD